MGGVVQYTEHLACLLFLKYLDEEDQERVAQASLGEGEHYEPVLQGDLAWDAWAGPEKLGAWKVDDLVQFVRGRLLPGLSTLTGSPLARTVARIFSDESVGDQNVVRNVPVCASGYNLKDVLTIINSIHFGSDDDIVCKDLLAQIHLFATLPPHTIRSSQPCPNPPSHPQSNFRPMPLWLVSTPSNCGASPGRTM